MSEFEWAVVEGSQIDESILDQLFGKRTPAWLARSTQKYAVSESGIADAEIFQQILNVKQISNSRNRDC